MRIAAAASAFPEQCYPQAVLTAALQQFWGDRLRFFPLCAAFMSTRNAPHGRSHGASASVLDPGVKRKRHVNVRPPLRVLMKAAQKSGRAEPVAPELLKRGGEDGLRIVVFGKRAGGGGNSHASALLLMRILAANGR